MNYQKIFYISGAVFFISASILAIAMIIMMLGGPFMD